ncbi:hypothetical protein CDAR_209151 [Caerostris darwini]|uniref:Uncharacterized protein n=1 Tax=Caerostris darwini TaxID=1538125 RepID=A0AAV4VFE6_9ARAC|nr:hypothetical protein CDAR_209151 [Caerostris darwini]
MEGQPAERIITCSQTHPDLLNQEEDSLKWTRSFSPNDNRAVLRGVSLISEKFEGGRAISDVMFCHEGSPLGNLCSEKIKGQPAERSVRIITCPRTHPDLLNQEEDSLKWTRLFSLNDNWAVLRGVSLISEKCGGGSRAISSAMFCHTGSPLGNLWSEMIKVWGQLRKRMGFSLFCHVSSMDVLMKNADNAECRMSLGKCCIK